MGLIKLTRSWSLPDLSDQVSLESAWHDWARHETLKVFFSVRSSRVKNVLPFLALSFLAYLQDCSILHSLFDNPSLPGIRNRDQPIPCDDAVWRAQTSAQRIRASTGAFPLMGWAYLALGINMRFALTSLEDRKHIRGFLHCQPSFASFIVIHGILCDILSTQKT